VNELLTEKELAERLKVSTLTLYRQRKAGMPYVRVGQQVRYDVKKVQQWLNKQNGGR
jgi:excisionase family DNA binding protein